MYDTNSGFADDPAYAGAQEYSGLFFPITRAAFDRIWGTPVTGGTRTLKRGLVRWAEYEDGVQQGVLRARWVSLDAKSDIGYGFVI